MPNTARHALRRRAAVLWRRFVATVLIAGLAVAALVVFDIASVSAAPGVIAGTVFRDFNSNGQQDTAGGIGVAVDTGIAAVTVTGYDRDGIAVGSTTTAVNGSYTLNVAPLESNHVRVEFTSLPLGFQDSFRGTGATGVQNAGSIQFVQVGATNVNYGASAPEDYSQSNPPIITPIQHAGLASHASLANEPAITAIPWTAGFTASNGQGGSFPNRTTLATVPQVGSIWGTAFQGSTNSLYAAATYKRQAGMGPGGLGQIYRISGVLGTNGAITTGTPTVSQWLNLQGKSIVGGGTVDLGTAATDAVRGISTPVAPAGDLDAYQRAGEIGIGAMSISADQKTLYFVNLFDRNLYSVDITNPVTAATTPIINRYSLGLSGNQRPWAVEIHRGYIYIGYVDSGESLAVPASASSADLRAHVIRASETTPNAWSTDLLNMSLGYAKGSPVGAGSPSDSTFANRWNSWTDEWSWTGGSVEITWYGTPAHVFPQPLLSNLQFDSDGYLTLGFLDRASLQGGNRNHSTIVGDTDTYQSLASGDILIASQAANGTLTIENNGSVGARGPSTNAGNSQGPGGGEFYNDRHAVGTGSIHNEFALGGLTGMGGVAEVVSSSYDPLDQVRVAGINWVDSATGAVTRGYNQTPDAGGGANADGTFQKGGGLGDIQALSSAAPIQIGNRVWFDSDPDGIQDADEGAIAGVTVNLIQGSTTIATRTTNALGEYYFSSSDADLEGEFIADGGSYTVQFVKPTSGTLSTALGTVAWSDTSFTSANAGSNSAIDSNAVPNVSNATLGEYAYTAGSYGVNDHRIDAGLRANGTLRVLKAIDPNGGVAPPGATYPLTLSVVDFRGDSYDVGANAAFAIGVGAANAHDVALPIGAVATVAEAADATVRSWSVNPTSPVTITGSGAARSVVTVTNTLYLPGTFTVAKTVTGEGASQVGSSAPFTVEYTYPAIAPTWKTMTVLRDGAPVASDPIPYNASVTIRETTPTTPANVIWGVPSWSVNSITTTALTQTITIGDGTNVAVALENPTSRQYGSFSVTKVVSGPGAAGLVSGFDFTGTYNYVGRAGGAGSFSLENGQTWTLPGTELIPAGTVVTIAEDAPSGGLAAYRAWTTPVLTISGTPFGTAGSGDFSIGANSTIAVGLENPTVIVPQVTIQKGDGTGTTIVHEADTMPAAEYFAPGETRTIVIRVTNTGVEGLRQVELTDDTFSGGILSALEWTFPDGSTESAAPAGNALTASWSLTFGSGTSIWAPGEVITGTATLTVDASDEPHVNQATVEAVGVSTGLPVTASNRYNAYSAAIQIIHYDGNRPDPQVKDSNGDWVVPTNPLVDWAQDANTANTAVKYPAGQPQRMRWVISNTGTTYLTTLALSLSGGAQAGQWTCDMTMIGGTQTAFNFITDGPWTGVFAPNQSFFCDGPLTLKADEVYQDNSTVVGAVVIPETDVDGYPTGLPTLALGDAVFYTNSDGSPRIVSDADPFNATTRLSGLAYTGLEPATIWAALWIGVGGMLIGLLLMLLRRRQRGAHAAS